MKNLFCLAAFTVLVFTSCSKEDTLQTAWFTYNETKCADPWGHNSNVSPLVALNGHLAELEIETEDTEYDAQGTEAQSCEACGCLSGGVFRVKIDEAFQDQLEALGFVAE